MNSAEFQLNLLHAAPGRVEWSCLRCRARGTGFSRISSTGLEGNIKKWREQNGRILNNEKNRRGGIYLARTTCSKTNQTNLQASKMRTCGVHITLQQIIPIFLSANGFYKQCSNIFSAACSMDRGAFKRRRTTRDAGRRAAPAICGGRQVATMHNARGEQNRFVVEE